MSMTLLENFQPLQFIIEYEGDNYIPKNTYTVVNIDLKYATIVTIHYLGTFYTINIKKVNKLYMIDTLNNTKILIYQNN